MKKKIIAVIPILLGSKRVKDKNLLLVDGDILASYVLKSALNANVFDEIYIDSEHEEFNWLAEKYNVKFRHRNPEFGGTKCIACNGNRCQVHDHFLGPLLTEIDTDYLVQIHTTSPLLKTTTIVEFVKKLVNYDTLIGCESHQIESFINGKEINFSFKKKQPTQELVPIQTVSWAITGWNKSTFLNNIKKGPTFSGNISYFKISKIESLDIDTPEDLFIVEACLNHLKRKDNVGKQYVDFSRLLSIERDLNDLIAKDGSPVTVDLRNQRIMNVTMFRDLVGTKSVAFPVIWTDNDQVCFIQQSPGEGSRLHYHPTKDEFWIIFEGTFEYFVESDHNVTIAKKGDIIYIPKGITHKITCIGNEVGLRLACGENNFSHVYVK